MGKSTNDTTITKYTGYIFRLIEKGKELIGKLFEDRYVGQPTEIDDFIPISRVKYLEDVIYTGDDPDDLLDDYIEEGSKSDIFIIEKVEFTTKFYPEYGEDGIVEKKLNDLKRKVIRKEKGKSEEFFNRDRDSNRITEAKEYKFSNSNLYFTGIKMDSNGNKVALFNYPNQKSFSIQTNQNLPLIEKRVRKGDYELTNELEDEVIDYIQQYGSKTQKNSLKVYENENNSCKRLTSDKNSKDKTERSFDQLNMINSYLEAALWTTLDKTGKVLGDTYSIEDISERSIEQARKDCNSFIEVADYNLYGLNSIKVGRDFWLTRNKYGMGFKESDYDSKVEKFLVKVSESFPESIVYVEKGVVYIQ